MSPVGSGPAEAQEFDGEFIVFKGSTARKQGVPLVVEVPDPARPARRGGEARRRPAPAHPSLFVFREDVADFSRPSAAAAVVFGGNQAAVR